VEILKGLDDFKLEVIGDVARKANDILVGMELNEDFENFCRNKVKKESFGPETTEMRYFEEFEHWSNLFRYQKGSCFCIGFYNNDISDSVEVELENSVIKSVIISSYSETEDKISKEEYDNFPQKVFIEGHILHDVYEVFGLYSHNQRYYKGVCEFGVYMFSFAVTKRKHWSEIAQQFEMTEEEIAKTEKAVKNFYDYFGEDNQ